MPFPPSLLGPWFALTAAAWWLGVHVLRRLRRPLRLRIGPDGLAVRDTASEEFSVAWHAVAAVTIGPRPGSADSRPWLIVWPVPGAVPARPCSAVVDGHQAHVLVRLDRLPGGAAAVASVVQGFAGERFSQ